MDSGNPTEALASTTAAASHTSSTAAAAATANATTAEADAVKLLIKASNQQYDDQIIESNLLWSVKRLKTQLSMVYPSKPPVADQKLIYSGQLLNDHSLLKDVIRNYKDVYTQNHIIHLVYTPKNFLQNLQTKPKIMSGVGLAGGAATTAGTGNGTSATDGLRQRNVAARNGQIESSQTHQQQQQQQQQHTSLLQQPQQQQQYTSQQQYMRTTQFIPASGATTATAIATAAPTFSQCQNYDPANNNNNNTQNNATASFASLPFGFPMQMNGQQAFAAQQAAMYNWMQQVYSQYMDQVCRFSNVSGNMAATPATGMGAAAAGATMPSQQQQQSLPFLAPQLYPNPVIAYPSAPFVAQPPQLQLQPIPIPTAAVAAAATPVATSETSTATGQQQQQHRQQQLEQQQQQQAQEEIRQQQQAQQAQQARFPNVMVDEQENRDWLDSFFSIMRLAIFLTVLYFNSSPLRCLAVMVIASCIYLYHIGVFRFRHEHNNNNNHNNNAEQIRQGVQQVQQAQAQAQAQQQQNLADEDANNPPNGLLQARPEHDVLNDVVDGLNNGEGQQQERMQNMEATNTNNNNNNDSDAARNEQDDEDDEDNSVFSIVRTFIVTFVTSMFPETPAL